MWTEANVSIRSARIILSHLNQKFKHRVQVPLKQVSALGAITDRLQPMFKNFIFRQNDGDKNKEQKKEKIQYWTYPIVELLLCDYERLLQSELPSFTEFGYYSKAFDGQKGVIVVIGSDHGCAKSRFLIRTNYLSSKSRHQVNKADYGTRTLQFAEVDCKKDVCEVHSKIAPDINVAIEKLETSKLVAVRLGEKIVKCLLVPVEAINLRTIFDSDELCIVYSLNNNDVKMTIDDHLSHQDTFSNDSIEIKTIIPKFKIVIAGDLSYFATCTGRDGSQNALQSGD